jgi:putative acetyltransferase
MKIRTYRPADCVPLMMLFYDTIHTACTADYTPAQLDAWAPADRDCAAWDRSLKSRTTLVAEEDGQVLGFGNIGPDGYLDLLYVHRDWQRRGVAAALCDFLETLYPVDRVTVHASKTARPFFEARGYRVLETRQAERQGQSLTNYLMEKELI